MPTITTDLEIALGILTAAVLHLNDRMKEHQQWIEDELVTIQESLEDIVQRRYH